MNYNGRIIKREFKLITKIVVATGVEAQRTHPAGLIGAIETISMTVGVFCGMVPEP